MSDRRTPAPTGGADRVSTKTKLAADLVILGEVLVRAREARGLKQSEVAGRLGLPASYLSKVEKGNRRLDAIELIRIAEAMEADPAEIIREVQRALPGR
ncbi:MAG TPA: helix-turn-helix transcriptional regulator [Thermoanaerobaculia bacterium]|nr:helix-turn-helix transcriptional regulator [Thermoanaerobaculia bacterium]